MNSTDRARLQLKLKKEALLEAQLANNQLAIKRLNVAIDLLTKHLEQ